MCRASVPTTEFCEALLQGASKYETESAEPSCSRAPPGAMNPATMTKRWTGSAVSEAALLLVLTIMESAQAAQPQCMFPNEIIDLGHPLHRMSRPLSTGGPLTIVALGSSSTAGAGASKPEASYPTRLREHLSLLLGRRVIVVNAAETAIASAICCSDCRRRSFLSTGCRDLAARNERFVD